MDHRIGRAWRGIAGICSRIQDAPPRLDVAGDSLMPDGSRPVCFEGGPTDDKPDITFAPPGDVNTVSSELTFRVPDCRAAYDALTSRGAQFLTPPMAQDWGGEIRCFLRDPDGHLLEFSQLL
ncbi:MAG: VOC family protein [Acidobacteria bacterium]|nr:VOC family protein [Acidobacteriota bacterium]